MGPRYSRNKMGLVTKAIVLNLHCFYFHLSGILKDDKTENKLKHIYQVETTYGTLGALSASQGPFRGQSVSFGSL